MQIFHFDHQSDQHHVWLRGAATPQCSRCFPGTRLDPPPTSKSHADACVAFWLCSSKLQNFPYLYEPKKLAFDMTSLCHWASQVVLVVKNLPASAEHIRNMGLIPGRGRSPGGGQGDPLQYSCPDNPMDRGAWQITVYRVAQSQIQLK